MSARYFTKVSNILLAEMREPGFFDPLLGFRLVKVLGADSADVTWCEFEDAGAPAWMNGYEVTPTFSRGFSDTEQGRIWISERHLDSSVEAMSVRMEASQEGGRG